MPVSLWVKSFKLGFSSIRTENFRMYKWGLGKAEAPVIKLSTFVASWRSKGILGGKSDFCFIDYAKPLTVWIKTNCGKFFKRLVRPLDLSLEKSVCRSGSNRENWTWNNRLVPNRERSTSRLYIVTLLISLLCRVHHKKHWAGGSTGWNQDCQEKYQ